MDTYLEKGHYLEEQRKGKDGYFHLPRETFQSSMSGTTKNTAGILTFCGNAINLIEDGGFPNYRTVSNQLPIDSAPPTNTENVCPACTKAKANNEQIEFSGDFI